MGINIVESHTAVSFVSRKDYNFKNIFLLISPRLSVMTKILSCHLTFLLVLCLINHH